MKVQTTQQILLRLICFIAGILLIGACNKKESLHMDRAVLVKVIFDGDVKPEIGDKAVVNGYFFGRTNPQLKGVQPDIVDEISLTKDQIDNGLSTTITVPYEYPFVFVSAYVDLNGDDTLSKGDLAIFYNDKDYETVLNGAKPDTVGANTNITINLNSVLGYGKYSVTDIDGNTYRAIKVGEQIWMAENLRVTRYRDGTPIPTGLSKSDWNNTREGAYAIYPYSATSLVDSDEEMIAGYGLLYNAYAVNDSRNIAPEGWRVATDEDWKELEMALGMSKSDADGTSYRGSPVANKLKTSDGWGENHGTNDVGFSMVPAGNVNNAGDFSSFGTLSGFWTSSPSATQQDRQVRRFVKDVYGSVGRDTYYKSCGYSVRCIKIK